ncbi:MAG: tRNA (adenosine(37)-N6)-dimethylallyltransferase MiaA [Coriobacteriales bacterium]|nr:tRNA (adenosine(37)-N6)-dimethylallyltransferase MiaA [Coriobacteriales bacterium]MBQ6586756.1 tRNA (adenosine(37)-N6)-dimethylallyltransferase MiaA [Coriobacteriales bacterium]
MPSDPTFDIATLSEALRGRVVAVVGCTASGKSALAEALARTFDAEIVSADSMQIYRGMDIGTAKTPLAQRDVAYHCLDIIDPGEPFSAALFQQLSRAAIQDINGRGKLAIVCGGTGFYVRAALDDMDFPAGEQLDNPVRQQWSEYARAHGAQALHDLLAQRDPESASVIHPNNVKRVVRAFELLEQGESYAKQARAFKGIPELLPACWIGINVEPEVLYERIDRRVDRMVSEGLFAEVESLLREGFRQGLTAPQAIGYKELVPVIDAGYGPDSPQFEGAIVAIKQASRRYAKRQRSWFKAESRIHWIDDATHPSDEEKLMEAYRILGQWLEGGDRDE